MALDTSSDGASETECLSFLGKLSGIKIVKKAELLSENGKSDFFILTLEDGNLDDEKLMEYATIIQNDGLVNIEECIFYLEDRNPSCRRLKSVGIKQFEMEKFSIA
ncbi:hypothetical protein KA071_03595 [Candidatus Gracilibacteria bacterium]|nr:hypothetical protein [Candidatus Gracilibacteria bacterium]